MAIAPVIATVKQIESLNPLALSAMDAASGHMKKLKKVLTRLDSSDWDALRTLRFLMRHAPIQIIISPHA